MHKRAKNNTLQTRQRSWINSMFKKIKIKFDLQPIDKPQEPHKKKKLTPFSLPVFVISMVLVIFVILILAALPEPVNKTPIGFEPMQLVSTPSPIPSEWVANARQAEGIAFGGVVLVLIVVIGTLGVIRIRRKPKIQPDSE